MTETKTNGGAQSPAENRGQIDHALNALRGAAMAGDLSAKLELGEMLLASPRGPSDFFEAAAITVSAANDGDGASAYRTAVLAAGAISMRQSWPTALVYLQRAAELGYEPAREELCALAGDKELAARALSGEETSIDVWRRLRHAVDLKALTRIGNAKALGLSPRLAVMENFLAPELCDLLVEKSRGMLAPLEGPEGKLFPVEVAASHRLAIRELNLRILLMVDRIGEAVALQNRGVEPPFVIRYGGGEEYPAHSDFLDPRQPQNAENIRQDGQRVVTFLIFLNDDYEGGETEFPERQIRGKKGDAVFWWNVKPDGTPDPAAINANRPVTRGEKWVLSQWIRSALPRRN